MSRRSRRGEVKEDVRLFFVKSVCVPLNFIIVHSFNFPFIYLLIEKLNGKNEYRGEDFNIEKLKFHKQ